MNKNFKRTLLSTGLIALLLLAFAGGVLAANWKTFDGEEKGAQVESNIDTLVSLINDADGEYDSIVEYYKQVIKELQEQFTEQLKIVTDSKDKEILKLMKDIETLIQEIETLKNNQSSNDDYIKHLENQVDKANLLMQQLENYSSEAVEEVRK